MPQAYRIKTGADVGKIVYEATNHDYGLASDDTRMTGIEHISVSLKRSGGTPTFTIPRRDLEPCEVKPLPKITDSHVMEVCRPGEKGNTCRYLAMGAGGWSCEKHSSLATTLDSRVAAGTMHARGDNCEGRS